MTDFAGLWRHVVDAFAGGPHSVHGPDHWRRVESNGLFLLQHAGHPEPDGAAVEVVRLFAVLHDSRREHDAFDDSHGAKAAAHAASLRGVYFELADEHFALLQHACVWHTHGLLHEDPTVGACWDADRLDLGRVGIAPHARFMSTAIGREVAHHGSIDKFLSARPPLAPLRPSSGLA
jgi:uncharacterized protein